MPTPTPLDNLMYWQCRIRQSAMRHAEGRPSEGMRPRLTANGQDLGRIVTLIAKNEPHTHTAHFRHVVMRTQDPAKRLKDGLQWVSELYYQGPQDFKTAFFAVFALDSELAEALPKAQDITLDFEQDSQTHCVPCRAEKLVEDDAYYANVYWHNHMFNRAMPGRVSVVVFHPTGPIT